MRLDVAGDGLLEKLGLMTGMVPTPLIHTTFGVGYSRSIVAGTRLGIFEALGDGEAVPAEVAEQVNCHPEGTRALMAALVGFGLLERSGGRYRNSKAVKKWLLEGSEQSLKDAVLFLGYCHELVWNLEDDVRTGAIVRVHDKQHPPEFWDAYMGALAAFARLLGKEVVKRVKVGTPRRMLDVGGGHGVYSAALCGRYEGLTADVLDLEPACVAGRRIQEADGTADRVRHVVGDFRTADWGTGYDLVLVFNVLHNATEEESRSLIRKAHAALNPGGRLVISDAKHLGEDGKLDASAGWNELFFFLISGAQAWPEATLRGWMTEAGFSDLKRTEFLMAPQIALAGTA